MSVNEAKNKRHMINRPVHVHIPADRSVISNMERSRIHPTTGREKMRDTGDTSHGHVARESDTEEYSQTYQ